MTGRDSQRHNLRVRVLCAEWHRNNFSTAVFDLVLLLILLLYYYLLLIIFYLFIYLWILFICLFFFIFFLFLFYFFLFFFFDFSNSKALSNQINALLKDTAIILLPSSQLTTSRKRVYTIVCNVSLYSLFCTSQLSFFFIKVIGLSPLSFMVGVWMPKSRKKITTSQIASWWNRTRAKLHRNFLLFPRSLEYRYVLSNSLTNFSFTWSIPSVRISRLLGYWSYFVASLLFTGDEDFISFFAVQILDYAIALQQSHIWF
jgi:hypothetical protein